MDQIARFSINCHSSIRCGGNTVLWFDPYRVAAEPHDGDVIFVTHSHSDHLSPDDIRRVMKPDAVLVLPESCRQAALDAGLAARQLMPVRPGARYEVRGVTFETVPAYNLNKKFHPRANNWVGYVVTVDGLRFYVAGDTDDTPGGPGCPVRRGVPAGGRHLHYDGPGGGGAGPPASVRKLLSPPTTAASWAACPTATPSPQPSLRTSPASG